MTAQDAGEYRQRGEAVVDVVAIVVVADVAVDECAVVAEDCQGAKNDENEERAIHRVVQRAKR